MSITCNNKTIELIHSNITIPVKCPACGSVLDNNGIQLFCLSDICPAKNFQRILNFIKATKIDNFGEALVEKFFDMGKIKTIADIFTLKKEDVSTLEGWGEKSADTIIANINSKRKMDPAVFLASMGIPTLSDKTAEDLIKKFETLDRVRTASVEEISAIKGYSTISATSVVSGLKAYSAQISEVLKHIELQSQIKGGKLSGMSFCFTGEMSNPRSFYQGLVTKHGGKSDSGVTKSTTYLVCNENKGSSKSRKAEQYGSKIINEQEFMSLVGETVIQPKPKTKTGSLFEE
jgi:DNA ligase (NAD+)